MRVNHLFVVPDQTTLDYFKQQVSGCPFAIHPEDFRVTIAITEHDVEPHPDAYYLAKAGMMELFPNIQMVDGSPQAVGSSLILPLLSIDMVKAEAEIGGNPFNTLYSPHLTVVEHTPPLKNYIRSWINSLSGIFLRAEIPFVFVNETVETIDLDIMPSLGFIQDQTDKVNTLREQAERSRRGTTRFV